MTTPYNPLDKKNLGKSVADALLEMPIAMLPPTKSFVGAGVYAIYYVGKFPHYLEISKKNSGGKFELPIYVGKAVPPGARKGGFGLDENPGTALYGRLNEHAKSIEQTTNLDLDDFRCRFLVADDIWIPLGESLLIKSFSPLWNKCLDGFGNHDPGAGRYEGQRPPWDVMHPGRPWAMKCKPHGKPVKELERAIREYFTIK